MNDGPEREERGSWTEKYRPQRLDEMVGLNKVAQTMMEWARKWSEGKTPKKRGLILEGEPGVGKTTAAIALANEMGWETIELNASDARNLETIRNVATRGAITRDITDMEGYSEGKHHRSKLILMDEADNLYERAASTSEGTDVSDRGGKRAIVELIRMTRQPVILIVNDLYGLISGSGSSLTYSCEKIKFRRLGPASIAKRLRQICDSEGIVFETGVVTAIAERSGGDLRSAIADLQIVCAGRSRIGISDMNALGFRDIRENIFKTLDKVFSSQSLKGARGALMDTDEDINSLMLWMSQNITAVMSHPQDIDRAMGLLSRADVYMGRVRRRQNYGLWSYAKDTMAAVSMARKHPNRNRSRYQFPSYLKSMSRTKGSRALLKEAASSIGRLTHSSIRTVKEDAIYRLGLLASRDPEFASSLLAQTELGADHLKILTGGNLSGPDIKSIIENAKALASSMSAPEVYDEIKGGLETFGSSQTPKEKKDESDKEQGAEKKEDTGKKEDDQEEEDEASPKQASLFEF